MSEARQCDQAWFPLSKQAAGLGCFTSSVTDDSNHRHVVNSFKQLNLFFEVLKCLFTSLGRGGDVDGLVSVDLHGIMYGVRQSC